MQTKQVIVVRTKYTDKNGNPMKLRAGKLIAQASHSVLKVFIDLAKKYNEVSVNEPVLKVPLDSAMLDWINGLFTKVCVQVDSENELLEIYHKAKNSNIICSLITDAGLTEFHGVPTTTCVAIGPDYCDRIDAITGHLKLY